MTSHISFGQQEIVHINKDEPIDMLEMYKLWLSGKSVRKIAAIYGISRMGAWYKLTKTYGLDACSPAKQSLARVAYQEYQDFDLAMRAMGIEGLFISPKTEDNYTRYQTKAARSNQTYVEEGFEPDLLWFYFKTLVDVIADGVAEVYASALIEMSMTQKD